MRRQLTHAALTVTILDLIRVFAGSVALAEEGVEKRDVTGKSFPIQEELITDGRQWVKLSVVEINKFSSDNVHMGANVIVRRGEGGETFYGETSPGVSAEISSTNFKLLEITWTTGKSTDDLKADYYALKPWFLDKDDIRIEIPTLLSRTLNLARAAVPRDRLKRTVILAVERENAKFPPVFLKLEEKQ